MAITKVPLRNGQEKKTTGPNFIKLGNGLNEVIGIFFYAQFVIIKKIVFFEMNPLHFQ